MALSYGYEFVAMPAAAWDANLTLGEFRLLGYIIRHLHRINAVSTTLTDEELLNGAIGKDFVRLDEGCGLTRNTIKMARAELRAKGLLSFDANTGTYSIPQVSKIDTQSSEQVSTIHTLTVGEPKTPVKSSMIDTSGGVNLSIADTPHLVSEQKKPPPIIPPLNRSVGSELDPDPPLRNAADLTFDQLDSIARRYAGGEPGPSWCEKFRKQPQILIEDGFEVRLSDLRAAALAGKAEFNKTQPGHPRHLGFFDQALDSMVRARKPAKANTRTQTVDLYAGQPKTPEEARARRRAKDLELQRLGCPMGAVA